MNKPTPFVALGAILGSLLTVGIHEAYAIYQDSRIEVVELSVAKEYTNSLVVKAKNYEDFNIYFQKVNTTKNKPYPNTGTFNYREEVYLIESKIDCKVDYSEDLICHNGKLAQIEIRDGIHIALFFNNTVFSGYIPVNHLNEFSDYYEQVYVLKTINANEPKVHNETLDKTIWNLG